MNQSEGNGKSETIEVDTDQLAKWQEKVDTILGLADEHEPQQLEKMMYEFMIMFGAFIQDWGDPTNDNGINRYVALNKEFNLTKIYMEAEVKRVLDEKKAEATTP